MGAAVRAALERDSTIALRAQPAIDIEMRNGTVVLRGEVTDIAAKRRIAMRVASMRGVDSVLDRLRVVVTRPRGDGAIAETLHARLASETVFGRYRIQLREEADTEAQTEGREILIEVANGVVTLTGEVQSLSHRRFADVLAWWTPGVADVDNRLLVRPREDDSDDEIADALRLVFEKDPSLDASGIHAETHDGTVRLEGLVHSEEQKRHAELDAWCILGVHDVENRIEVRA
ncbi:MAG: BON domain-containing protein [Gammaproteobacteria bacterium]